MKTLILLLLTTTTILLSGCRAYRGFRDYDEDKLIKIDNKKVVSVSYDIYQSGDKLKLSESKEIEFRENWEKTKTREWVSKQNTYHYLLIKEPGFVTVLGAIFAFPIDVAAYPFRLMYSVFSPSEEIRSAGHYYYVSKGRKFWLHINPLFSIFQINGSIDNWHWEYLDQKPYSKQKSKREQKELQDNILVKSKNKNFTVPSNIEIREISQKLFTYPLPKQEETVKFKYKTYEQDFSFSSEELVPDEYTTNYNLAINASSEECFNKKNELLNKVEKLENLKYISPEHSKNLKKEISSKSINYGKKYKQEILKQISIMPPETCFEQKNYLEQEIKKFENVLGDTKVLKNFVTKKINEYKLQLERKLIEKINKMQPERCYNDKSNLENEIRQIGQIIEDTKKIQIALEKKLNQYKNQIKKQFLDKINKMSPELCVKNSDNLIIEINNIGVVIGDTNELVNCLLKKQNDHRIQLEQKLVNKIVKMSPELIVKNKDKYKKEIEEISINPTTKEKMLKHINNCVMQISQNEKKLLNEIKTLTKISKEEFQKYSNRISNTILLSPIEIKEAQLHITKIHLNSMLKEIDNSKEKFPLTKISKPISLYKNIYSGASLKWLKIYATLNNIPIELVFNNLRISSDDKLLIYHQNKVVIGVNLYYVSNSDKEYTKDLKALIEKFNSKYGSLKIRRKDFDDISLSNKKVQIFIKGNSDIIKNCMNIVILDNSLLKHFTKSDNFWLDAWLDNHKNKILEWSSQGERKKKFDF